MRLLGKKRIFFKQNKGITLIALIITIIVLLILAGVAINTLSGDSGIINRSVNAKKGARDVEIEEKVYLDVSASKINKDSEVDENKLRKWLGKSFGEEGKGFILEGNKIDGWIITIPENESSYFVNAEGEMEKTEYEAPIDNSDSLVLGFVDDLGTRAMIYLYANPDKCTAGETVTITDSQGNTLTNVDDEEQATVKAVAKNGEGKFEIKGNNYNDTKQYYIAYPVTKNGAYRFKATNGTTITETNIKVNNIEIFTPIEDLAKKNLLTSKDNGRKSYDYKGATVPRGYFVDTRSSIDTGLVITDKIDSDGYSLGDEWVWVPVNDIVGNNDYYGVEESEKILAGTEDVAYTKYSKLYSFSQAKTRDTYGTFYPYGNISGNLGAPSTNYGYREIAVSPDNRSGYANTYDQMNNRTTGTVFSNIKEMATQFRDDYESMVTSVDYYKGFYIGRYEITENGEKFGESLTNKTWHELYNKCLEFGKEEIKNNTTLQITESSMMYGALWDATMKWLEYSNYNVGYTGTSWNKNANYYYENVTVSNSDKTTNIIVKKSSTLKKLKTGQTSYTESNNIYDLSGNCWDWTQEANEDGHRVLRGGRAAHTYDAYTYTASREYGNEDNPRYGSEYVSSRPQLYIK